MVFLDRFLRQGRAGNSLIWFLSESLVFFVFCFERMSDSLKEMSDSLIHSFLVNEMSDSLTPLISSERPEQIAHGRSFDLSEMSEWANSQPCNTIKWLPFTVPKNTAPKKIWTLALKTKSITAATE